jgi:hypothetical protein
MRRRANDHCFGSGCAQHRRDRSIRVALGFQAIDIPATFLAGAEQIVE